MQRSNEWASLAEASRRLQIPIDRVRRLVVRNKVASKDDEGDHRVKLVNLKELAAACNMDRGRDRDSKASLQACRQA